jgi:hypothetical protein
MIQLLEKQTENRDALLGFKVTKKEAEQIKEYCHSKQISISDFLRACINKGMYEI